MANPVCSECWHELRRFEGRALPGYGSLTGKYRGAVCIIDPWVCVNRECKSFCVVKFYLDPDKRRYARENLNVMKRVKEYKEKPLQPFFKGYLGYETEEDRAKEEEVPNKKGQIIVDGEIVEEYVEPAKEGILGRLFHRKRKKGEASY